MKSLPSADAAVDQLCTRCGLCCNGVLFADVELRPTDSRALASQGLNLQRKGRKLALVQPCSCFDGKLCRIYEVRPSHCRGFECGLLRRVQAGALTARAALRIIRQAQELAAQVRDLLLLLGNPQTQLPLSRRYSQVMAEPIDFTADESVVERRGELMVKVDRLMTLLHRRFLS